MTPRPTVSDHCLEQRTAMLISRLVLESETFRPQAPNNGFALLPCWRERQDGQVYLCRLDGRRITTDGPAANGGDA